MTIEGINQRTIFINSPQNLESFSVKFTQLFLHEIKMNGKSQLYTIAAALSFMASDENNKSSYSFHLEINCFQIDFSLQFSFLYGPSSVEDKKSSRSQDFYNEWL